MEVQSLYSQHPENDAKFKTNIIGETVMHEFCVTSKSEPLAPRAPTWFDETHKLKVQTSNLPFFLQNTCICYMFGVKVKWVSHGAKQDLNYFQSHSSTELSQKTRYCCAAAGLIIRFVCLKIKARYSTLEVR